MFIITHRGLQPSNPNFPTESSFQAFVSQLQCGFGLEFDANFTANGDIVIFHDTGLERITNGENKSLFVSSSSQDIKKLRLGGGDRLCFLEELLPLIKSAKAPLSALHLKSKFQETKYLDRLIASLKQFESLSNRLIIFDVKTATAAYLKKQLPWLNLAPSVAHPYDIRRYNEAVGGTLLSPEEVLAHQDLFSWVWLDEWDLAADNGSYKQFYTADVFQLFKTRGLRVALVTPELHSTSPGLLGSEAHPDAVKPRLFDRIREIIALKPHALCTDYPEEVRQMIG